MDKETKQKSIKEKLQGMVGDFEKLLSEVSWHEKDDLHALQVFFRHIELILNSWEMNAKRKVYHLNYELPQPPDIPQKK